MAAKSVSTSVIVLEEREAAWAASMLWSKATDNCGFTPTAGVTIPLGETEPGTLGTETGGTFPFTLSRGIFGPLTFAPTAPRAGPITLPACFPAASAAFSAESTTLPLFLGNLRNWAKEGVKLPKIRVKLKTNDINLFIYLSPTKYTSIPS